jgi:hypothetical protein
MAVHRERYGHRQESTGFSLVLHVRSLGRHRGRLRDTACMVTAELWVIGFVLGWILIQFLDTRGVDLPKRAIGWLIFDPRIVWFAPFLSVYVSLFL